jgi:hypothetical protein
MNFPPRTSSQIYAHRPMLMFFFSRPGLSIHEPAFDC